MAKITRRDSLGWFAAASAASFAVGATRAEGQEPALQQHWEQVSPREVIRSRYFPNVVLTSHNNKKVYLYDDLIKDKVMLLNFMYASCENLCPRVTQNLVKVQKLLGDRMGKDVFIYSFTLDPTHDTPEVLKAYAEMHHIGAGWSFLTGTADEMEMLRRRLGFTDPDPKFDKDKETHIGNVRYGNEPRLLWGACPGMSHPEFIVESLSWVDWPKGQKPNA